MLGFDSRRACEKIVPILNCLAGGRLVRSCGLAFEAGCAGRVVRGGPRRETYRFVEGSREIAHRRARGMRTSGACDALPMDPCAALPPRRRIDNNSRVRRVLLTYAAEALAEITGLAEVTGSASAAAAFVYESFTTHLRPLPPPLTCTARAAATVVFIPTSPKSPAIIFMSSAPGNCRLPCRGLVLHHVEQPQRRGGRDVRCVRLPITCRTAPIDTASASAASASHATPASS